MVEKNSRKIISLSMIQPREGWAGAARIVRVGSPAGPSANST